MRLVQFDFPVCSGLISSHPVQQRIAWRDFGLSLVVPPGALPEGTSIKVAVHCCQTFPFSIPVGLQLVSPVYLVAASPEATHLKPLQLALKHSINLTSEEMCSQLTFIMVNESTVLRAPLADNTPRGSLELRPTQGGLFKVGSSTGRISLASISQVVVAIAQCKEERVTGKGMTSKAMLSL